MAGVGWPSYRSIDHDLLICVIGDHKMQLATWSVYVEAGIAQLPAIWPRVEQVVRVGVIGTGYDRKLNGAGRAGEKGGCRVDDRLSRIVHAKTVAVGIDRLTHDDAPDAYLREGWSGARLVFTSLQPVDYRSTSDWCRERLRR